MMLATRIIHIYWYFYTLLSKGCSFMAKMDVSIVDIEDILFFNVVGLVLRAGFEDACYEHIPPVKSGKINQRIQVKRMLIKGSVPTLYTIVPHSFRMTFRKLRVVRFLLLFIARA